MLAFDVRDALRGIRRDPFYAVRSPLFGVRAWDPTVPHSNDRAFWCQHTYNCLGPDNKLVDDYECNPARKCYDPL